MKLWNLCSKSNVSKKAVASKKAPGHKVVKVNTYSVRPVSPPIWSKLPFSNADVHEPAKPVLKPSHLKDMFFSLSKGAIFRAGMTDTSTIGHYRNFKDPDTITIGICNRI